MTDFSKGKELIGLELDTYDAEGNDRHQKYFNAPKGRGYFTNRSSIAYNYNIIDDDGIDTTTKRLITRTKKKLREIEVLEFKHKNGVVLHPNQVLKINRKQELKNKLESLKNGTWIDNNLKPSQDLTVKRYDREKIRILARSTSIDWTGKYLDKQVVEVAVHDAVRVANGGTGVVKYYGPIDFLGVDKNVIGILMDQWHPSYGNGWIDGKQYFISDDGRGYFAHPPEIVENLGSTKPKGKIIMSKEQNQKLDKK